MARVWFLTGASRGLGRAMAEAVLAHGDKLVATARKPEQLSDLVEKYGDDVLAVALDVRDREQANTAVQAAVNAFGRIDVVVNNAGYGNLAAIEDATEEEFRDQIETNMWGVINVTRAALPVLREQRSGHFIQVTSVGGRVSTPGLAAYQTAKWGVEGFSGVLAKEVAPLGIKVTILEPGGMPTDWGGSSMTVTEPREEYRAALQWRLDIFDKWDSVTSATWGSDLQKISQVVLEVVEMPEPPLRLLIGSDAVEWALQDDENRLAETRKWEAISRSTDRK